MKKLTALIISAAMFTSALPLAAMTSFADTSSDVWMPKPIRVAETLDRGLVAMQTSDGVYLSWRLQADEDNVYGTGTANTSFDIYRDGTKIATESKTTNYIDTNGTASSKYQVVVSGQDKSLCSEVSVLENNYFDIALDKPAAVTLADGVKYSYTANDASCGDLDGDGKLELVLKWDCNGQDNANSGYTGNVYLDAYELEGSSVANRLWRIDLGQNIRGGAHYTQFLVYDFDGDGKAEVTCKTAPGSKDSNGNYITTASHVSEISSITQTENETNYTNTSGYILSGDEFLTVFNGQTGAAIDTIYYPNQRVDASVWGDTHGNRCDRYTADVAYLDGTTPYAVYMRGYYFGKKGKQRQAACAVSFNGSQLSCQYSFDTYDVTSYGSKSSSSSYFSNGTYKGVNGYRSGNEKYVGQGNHNCTVADVDNDGKDEVLTGALAYGINDNNLTVEWCTFRQHGDALHIGDYDPTHNGYEFFAVHEDNGTNTLSGSTITLDFGMSLIDAGTGDIMYHAGASGDTGRGVMANVGAGGYYQFWGAGTMISEGGTSFSNGLVPNASYNFRIFWDGDLYDELLDGTSITDWNGVMMINLFAADGCTSVNSSKSNPSLQADLFGDWREEVVYPLSDSSALRVYTTNIYTDYKMKSLMYDGVYRSGVAAEQTAYNQPPHIGYYLDPGEQAIDNVPEVTVPENATVVLKQNADGSGTDSSAYDVGMYRISDYNVTEPCTAVEGMSVAIGSSSGKIESSNFFGVTNTGNNNKAFSFGAGSLSTAGRGPVITFTDDIDLSALPANSYGALTFAVKLYDGIDNVKGAVYLLSDTTMNSSASDYKNKIATVTTDDIGSGEWAVIRYEFTGTTYKLYVNNTLKTSGSTTLAGLPKIAMPTRSSSKSGTYTGMMIDNICTYTVTAEATPKPTAAPTAEPTATPNVKTVTPQADTYLVYNDSTTAHGTDTELKINQAIDMYANGTPGLKEAKGLGLIRFDLSEYADMELESAVLHLYDKYTTNTDNASSALHLDYCSKDDWDEATLTANGITIRGAGTPLSSLNLEQIPAYSTSYSEITFDVTKAIKADSDNVHTFTLWTYTAREQVIASKEYAGADAKGPELVLTYKSVEPTTAPTAVPTATPTTVPTATPTTVPTATPTTVPTATPTTVPTATPTTVPTATPTTVPTATPTTVPTSTPTTVPTATPTVKPILPPISTPTAMPTATPTVPTTEPTATPTVPTAEPTATPTVPTTEPTATPTVPTTEPTEIPTMSPTAPPTTPTVIPTSQPVSTPTAMPTATPTVPTTAPTLPTPAPTEIPAATSVPTEPPTLYEWVEYDSANNSAVITSLTDKTGTVIFAGFSENGVLVSMSVKPDYPIGTGKTVVNPDDSFEVTNNVKVYVWDSLKSMKPIFEFIKE